MPLSDLFAERRRSTQRDLYDDLTHHIERCERIIRDGWGERKAVAQSQLRIYEDLLAAIEAGRTIFSDDTKGIRIGSL